MNIALQPLKIGIVGAGFSGTALTALLQRLTNHPLEIILFEKTGNFGMGDAYRTSFPFHLLNVKAHDMSAFEEDPDHFCRWVLAQSYPEIVSKEISLAKLAGQYVPRFIYHDYLIDLLKTVEKDPQKKIKITYQHAEVVDALPEGESIYLVLKDESKVKVDKAIFALGNNPPIAFPFPVSKEMAAIHNPWDYEAPLHIPAKEPVLIVGTGLSMIDTVLTLKHNLHQGPIYAVSRHGLLPLAHQEVRLPLLITEAQLEKPLRPLMSYLRQLNEEHKEKGGDWRALMLALRPLIAKLWVKLNLVERKQFLRHILPYWNVMRHRVHDEIAAILTDMQKNQQLKVLAGRIFLVNKDEAVIRLRGQDELSVIPIKWLINCLGPSLTIDANKNPIIQALLKRNIASLDVLNLGFNIDEQGALKNAQGLASLPCYTIGLLRRGEIWESSAVPDLRKQCLALAKHLLKYNKDRYERESQNAQAGSFISSS